MRRFCVLAGLLIAFSAPAIRAQRRVAVILDTSGSMRSSDVPRLTVQICQIIGDLLGESDRLRAIRLPQTETCSAGPDPSIAVDLDPSNRASFKRGIDALIGYGGDNNFASPVRTAIDFLSLDKSYSRMLLVIADSGGLADCAKPLTRELLELRKSGAFVAAINLDSSLGTWRNNPAFNSAVAARTPIQIVEAVAEVYQSFLGARQVQSGKVKTVVEVEIQPFCKEAFLVTVSGGSIGQLGPVAGNPAGVSVETDYRGGGSVRGQDGIVREYRIVRLERPSPGIWRFQPTQLSADAAWVLLRDYSVGIRWVSGTELPVGVQTPVSVELVDETTGRAITDLSQLENLEVTLDIQGERVKLVADPALPGRLTGVVKIDSAGGKEALAKVRSKVLDFERPFQLTAKRLSWALHPRTPSVAEVDTPLTLMVEAAPAEAMPPVRPEAIEVVGIDGAPVVLRDDGRGADPQAGDLVYSGVWTPTEIREYSLRYRVVGDAVADIAESAVRVAGRIDFGSPPPILLGPAGSGQTSESSLDLSGATARGEFQLEVESDFHQSGVSLELLQGQDWTPLGNVPVVLSIGSSGPFQWPVRVRVGPCPSGSDFDQERRVLVRVPGTAGKEVAIPLRLKIAEDPWLDCWWWLIALAISLLVMGVAVHGFWSPWRFSPRIGVQLSSDEDVEGEGFFHLIRDTKGSGSGFYRDAVVHVCRHRLSKKPVNGVVRLRADAGKVMMKPCPGETVFHCQRDGEWEPLPDEETRVRPDVVYRDHDKTIFFQVRVR